MRGPAILPPRLPDGRRAPARPSRRQRFDEVVLAVVAEVDTHWHHRLGLVEYAVEDAPMLPDDWAEPGVPLASLIPGTGSAPSRLVVFRRPIEHRCADRESLEATVFTVVVEQVADHLGIDPHDVHPRYRADG